MEVEYMAHLWLQNEDPEWVAHTLSGCEFNLRNLLIQTIGHRPFAEQAPSGVHLMKSENNDEDCWVILAGQGSDININGLPLFAGLHILRDRDEIRWSTEGLAYFSSEELAAVVDLPNGDRKIICPRCKQEIAPETPAVKCPRCGIWHHQSEELPCYTYAENCATCTRKTRLDIGYEWEPEEL
jgi:hypothetical protein